MFHLSGVKNFTGADIHDFRPLVAVRVHGITNDADGVSDFGLCGFQCVVPQKESGWKVVVFRCSLIPCRWGV
jgi:hypothetical protein